MSNGELVQSRIKVFNRPPSSPGKCAVCGSSNKPVIDIGLDVDFYGVVYFCNECATQIGKAVGMHIHDEVITLQMENLLVKKNTNTAEALLKDLASHVSSIVNTGINDVDRLFDSANSVVEAPEQESRSSETREQSEEPTVTTDDQSLSLEGSFDFSSSPSSDPKLSATFE